MADNNPHRPGPLKQKNKAHKTGRHRSKGAVDSELKGKFESMHISHKHKEEMRKEQRRNQIKQMRKKKRDEAMLKKRKIGFENSPPFLVCILPLHEQIDPNSALAILTSGDFKYTENTSTGITYVYVPQFKKRIAFVIPPIGRGNELATLDYLKVCDTTLLLTSASFGEDELMDKWGQRIFNMITVQGIPSPILALMDLESVNPKHRHATKANAQKFFTKLLPQQKIMPLDTYHQAVHVMRAICFQKQNVQWNRDNRSHLFGDHVEFETNDNSENGDFGTLKVTGFLRGQPLNVNGLVHIPGLGDFQLKQVNSAQTHFRWDQNKVNADSITVLAESDPDKQTSLQSENIPDSMDAEQTWPTEEEIKDSQMETKKMKLVKRVPKGWSDYQAAWIPDVEELTDNDDEESDDEDVSDSSANEEDINDGYVSCEDNSIDKEYDSHNEECAKSNGAASLPEVDDKYDLEIDLQEERDTLAKLKAARIDRMWPDEIDTPRDIMAKDRFQKYRGLESFKTSSWDANENLPCDYARLYKFKNFDRTKRRILADSKEFDGILPGPYITMFISNVSASIWRAYKSAQSTPNIVVYGLLPYEHQMSVMNVVLHRMPDSEVPLKSKEKLIVQCGYRRFVVNPIYSQHTNGDKHKFERYFNPHSTICATFYAPIQFPPASVLAFKINPDSTLNLVARGRLLSCNPDRIILKRVVLSGHPMRINRKSATIRYMFHNKTDVDYFSPVKLRTRCGHLGHIKESLGTHGHMKCFFDAQLRSYDTVFMYLYKRVFPKWTYAECIIQCDQSLALPLEDKSKCEAMDE